MVMLRRGLGLVLLCATGHVFSADIVVTTTEDITKNDDQCSLREAIEYINQGKPEAGLNGCGGKDATDNIILSTKEYLLNEQVRISKPMVFRTQYETTIVDDIPGTKNAVIAMKGTDRIFHIERIRPKADNEIRDAAIGVEFYEITLQGCTASVCKDKGGLILNYERLKFDKSHLINGKANFGGAIYNVESFIESETSKIRSARVNLVNSLLENNQAQQGAVLYSEFPDFDISASVIKGNKTTDSEGFAIYSHKVLSEDETKVTNLNYAKVINSTIFNNKGYIINVKDGIALNNNTLVFNDFGLIFNAPFKKALLTNNIIAKNGNLDCRVETAIDQSNLNNNLYGFGCEGTASEQLGERTLLAGTDVEGECDVNSSGILCPFKVYSGYALGYFRPRVLPSYRQLTDSPIINRGPDSNGTSCETVDQRGNARKDRILCDRGAIELIQSSTSSGRFGKDIFYGEIVKLNINDFLGDGELIPASQCDALVGPHPKKEEWQAGCMIIQQNNSPSKGKAELLQNGEFTYTPQGNWHGTDDFKVLVVVSTRQLNESINPYIEIPTVIKQDPRDTYTSDKVKTSGGGLGLISVLGLMTLIAIRRKK